MSNIFLQDQWHIEKPRKNKIGDWKKSLELCWYYTFCIVEHTNPQWSVISELNLDAPLGHSTQRNPGSGLLGGAQAPHWGTRMKGLDKTIPFRKTVACPSSKTLLYFRTGKLSTEVSTLVHFHLTCCDFCRAELMLLAHHGKQTSKDERTPEIPMNLRILAESIVCRGMRWVFCDSY